MNRLKNKKQIYKERSGTTPESSYKYWKIVQIETEDEEQFRTTLGSSYNYQEIIWGETEDE